MKNLYLSLVIFGIIGCSSSDNKTKSLPVIGTKSGSNITVIPAQVKDTTELLLSELIEDVEIIRLENNNEEAFIRGNTPLAISQNYIAARGDMSTPAKLFNRKTGAFIANLGHTGRGQGEYFSITNLKIDERSASVYLLPMMSDKLLRFGFDGNLTNSYPLVDVINKGAFKIDVEAQRITVANMPFQNSKYVVWTQDFDGKVINGVDAVPYTVTNYDGEMFHMDNTTNFDLFLTSQNSLWNYDDQTNKLESVFSIDLLGKKGYYVLVELPTIYMCSIFGGDVPRGNLFVDKETMEGGWYKLTNDLLGGINDSGFFWSGYYQWNVEPLMLIEKLEPLREKATGKARERIDYILDNVKEDDNNVIILGKLTQ